MRALRSLVLALSAGYTARAEPEPEVRRERPLAAILLFGLAFRNPAQCGPSVVARVAAPLRDAGFDVVTLAHSPTVAKLQYARTKEACGALGTRVRDLAPFGADRVVTHEQAHIDARLASLDAADGGGGAARFLARGDHDSEAGAKGHAVRNALRALWSLREVTRAADARGSPARGAALWVFLRADLQYLTNVTDVLALAAEGATGSTPTWHCNGGLNDRLFVGAPRVARAFGLRYERLGEYFNATRAPLHSESFAWWALRGVYLRPQGLLGVRRRCDGSLPHLDTVGYQNVPPLAQRGVALAAMQGAQRVSGSEAYLAAMRSGACKPVQVRSEHRSVYVYTEAAPRPMSPAKQRRRSPMSSSLRRRRRRGLRRTPHGARNHSGRAVSLLG